MMASQQPVEQMGPPVSAMNFQAPTAPSEPSFAGPFGPYASAAQPERPSAPLGTPPVQTSLADLVPKAAAPSVDKKGQLPSNGLDAAYGFAPGGFKQQDDSMTTPGARQFENWMDIAGRPDQQPKSPDAWDYYSGAQSDSLSRMYGLGYAGNDMQSAPQVAPAMNPADQLTMSADWNNFDNDYAKMLQSQGVPLHQIVLMVNAKKREQQAQIR